MQPEQDPSILPSPTSPQNRSILQTLKALGISFFWMAWDWFWKRFNLASVGDAMKEHSQGLNQKRAGVIVMLALFVVIGFWGGCYLQKRQSEKLQINLNTAKDEIGQLRLFIAGKPVKTSYAELMGFHDETNIVVFTNVIAATNLITKSLTNLITFYSSRPVLDFFQMERVKSQLEVADKIPICVIYSTIDTNASDLSKQIAQVFLASGFSAKLVGLPNSTNAISPFNGVTICSKQRPTGKIMAGLLQLFAELGQGQQYDTEPWMAEKDVYILVATNHK